MSDEERREKERAGKLGDKAAGAMLDADDARRGRGLVGFLQSLVGEQVFIEGVRINYRAIPREVLVYGDGKVAGILCKPLQRISYFDKPGPNRATTLTHTKPHFVPYEMIHDIGLEGFESQGDGWDPLE